jgi:Spy/CpxP family protein refolding chaperone
MRKSIIMGLGLALSLAGAASAQQSGTEAPRAKREHGGWQGKGQPGGPRGLLFKDITLTDAQKTQLKQMRDAQHEKMKANRETMKKQFDEMKAARERGDTAAVRAIRERNRQAMAQEREQQFAAIRNILTAEQRVQFEKNVAALKQREAERATRVGGRGEGRGRGGRPGRSG